MMERQKENEREREEERDSWQIPGSWSSVLNASEVSRCAKVTLYNNSFGFILWVVYTLCVPRDNHETANDPGTYSYCSRPAQNSTLPPVVYDNPDVVVAYTCNKWILSATLHLSVAPSSFPNIIFHAELLSLQSLNDYLNKYRGPRPSFRSKFARASITTPF